MASKSELNLCGITWPVCLLKFTNAISALCACETLEVTARDPDVVENIIMIVKRSEDTLINQQKEGEVYRLFIERGPQNKSQVKE